MGKKASGSNTAIIVYGVAMLIVVVVSVFAMLPAPPPAGSEFTGSFDYWLYRYQILFAAVITLSGAAMVLVSARMRIGWEEEKAEKENEISLRPARLKIAITLEVYRDECTDIAYDFGNWDGKNFGRAPPVGKLPNLGLEGIVQETARLPAAEAERIFRVAVDIKSTNELAAFYLEEGETNEAIKLVGPVAAKLALKTDAILTDLYTGLGWEPAQLAYDIGVYLGGIIAESEKKDEPNADFDGMAIEPVDEN
jgi:hypothetical protein